MVFGAFLSVEELGLDHDLFALVLLHLAEDGIFLKGLRWVVLSAKAIAECERTGVGRGANLDVILPRQVSVWMRPRTVDGHGLPLSRRSRVVGPTGPLAFLHLDDVKRWGYDGSGGEPHQSRRGWCWGRGRDSTGAVQVIKRQDEAGMGGG